MKSNSISINDGKAVVTVSIYMFKENDVFIVYCPSLDLTGYDYTEDLAKKDFKQTLDEWLEDQLEAGTLRQDLLQHGWKEGKDESREPAVSDLMKRKSSELPKILAMPEYVRTNMYTEVVTC